MDRPSTNGGNGRDARGRFAKGNPGGPGNPQARKVAALRSTLLRTVTQKDMREVTRAMMDKAKGGDVAAAKLLLGYLVGQPPAAIVVDLETTGPHVRGEDAMARLEALLAGS